MCQSPWDYCNAVLDGSGTPNCNFGARYNSSFAPMNGTPPTTAVAPTPADGAPTDADGAPTDADEAPAEISDEPGEITDNYLEPLPQ
jgi:hypothetical protein